MQSGLLKSKQMPVLVGLAIASSTPTRGEQHETSAFADSSLHRPKHPTGLSHKSGESDGVDVSDQLFDLKQLATVARVHAHPTTFEVPEEEALTVVDRVLRCLSPSSRCDPSAVSSLSSRLALAVSCICLQRHLVIHHSYPFDYD
jgi:hypothetical protein